MIPQMRKFQQGTEENFLIYGTKQNIILDIEEGLYLAFNSQLRQTCNSLALRQTRCKCSSKIDEKMHEQLPATHTILAWLCRYAYNPAQIISFDYLKLFVGNKFIVRNFYGVNENLSPSCCPTYYSISNIFHGLKFLCLLQLRKIFFTI